MNQSLGRLLCRNSPEQCLANQIVGHALMQSVTDEKNQVEEFDYKLR
jgi:hypothetical protein